MSEHAEAHDIEVLHLTESGYVARCNHCGILQLAFGNVIIDQNPDDFKAFTRLVRQYRKQYAETKNPKLKEIWLRTPYCGFRMIFSYEEIVQLDEIIQQAQLIITAEQLMQSKTD